MISKLWNGKEIQIPDIISESYLSDNPDFIFVFGDNTLRIGCGGAARLRHHPQALGFITKKFPNNNNNSFFTPESYKDTFSEECKILLSLIESNPDKLFLISKIGSGLANRYNIYEKMILPWLLSIQNLPNIVLL